MAILGDHKDDVTLRCCQLFDFLNDTDADTVVTRGVWLDHAAIQRPQTIAELMVCDGWGNLNRLFESGVLGAVSDATGQYFGIYYKHAPSKLLWEGAGIDFVCFGVGRAAARHCPNAQIIPVWVATFSLPPAPRVAIIFHITQRNEGGQDNTPPSSDAAAPTHVPLVTDNAPCSNWQAWKGWNLNRAKIATTASSKFERISVQLARIIKAFGLQRLVLVEPGTRPFSCNAK